MAVTYTGLDFTGRERPDEHTAQSRVIDEFVSEVFPAALHTGSVLSFPFSSGGVAGWSSDQGDVVGHRLRAASRTMPSARTPQQPATETHIKCRQIYQPNLAQPLRLAPFPLSSLGTQRRSRNHSHNHDQTTNSRPRAGRPPIPKPKQVVLATGPVGDSSEAPQYRGPSRGSGRGGCWERDYGGVCCAFPQKRT